MVDLLMAHMGEDPDNSTIIKVLSKAWLYLGKSVTIRGKSSQEDEKSKHEFRPQISPACFMTKTRPLTTDVDYSNDGKSM